MRDAISSTGGLEYVHPGYAPAGRVGSGYRRRVVRSYFGSAAEEPCGLHRPLTVVIPVQSLEARGIRCQGENCSAYERRSHHWPPAISLRCCARN